MKEYEFRVTQPNVGFYEGTLVIEAKSEKEAIKIAKGLSQEDLEDMCTGWTQVVECVEPSGDIEIHYD
jgi:hypothetical protein